MAYDLDLFMNLRRASGLVPAPGGDEAITTVDEVAPGGTKMRSSLWRVDLQGGDTERLTRSSVGERTPAYLPDGALLFVSSRPDPEATGDTNDDRPGALWCLPPGRGEAFVVASPPGGVSGIAVGRDSGRVVVAVDVHPAAESLDDDQARATARKDGGVTAHLFERFPIRYWDQYLGPRQRRYFALDPDVTAPTGFGELREVARTDGLVQEGSFDISPDGSTLVFVRRRDPAPTELAHDVVAVDLDAGDERVVLTGDATFDELAVSNDGTRCACVRSDLVRGEAPDSTLVLVDLATGRTVDLTPDVDLFPAEPAWSADDAVVAFVADRLGHRPILTVPVPPPDESGDVAGASTLTESGSFSSVQARPGGGWVAMRSHIDHPPTPVLVAVDGEITVLAGPTEIDVPGTVVDLIATADDGTAVRSWLVLPDGASGEQPAPLVVWVHGGPVSSWNDWSWRWNPWLLAERGYAVLLPDPALSTGYGLDHIRRGFGAWGDAPYTDVLAAVDAAEARPDVDGASTALMGGSFGGYMANWVAGHTDRFSCIVTHASLWALDQFHGTTDLGPWWELEFGDPYLDPSRYHEHSPHRSIGSITTPMLVIHGELDHRVPIGEALRLWTDLQRHGVESKFLYFPDENHWILKPQNARVWYEAVFAWLDHHVRGADWQRPALV